MRRGAVLVTVLVVAFALRGVCAAEIHELTFASEGTTLNALLLTPEGGTADTLLVYLHGNPGSPLAPARWLVDPLLDEGVAVFQFNYRGLWGNAGEFNLANAIGDLGNALSFLTAPAALSEYGVVPERIVLFGYSFGTAVALSGAHDDPRVAAIASFGPCDHGYFGAELADPNSPLRDFLDAVTEALFGVNGPIQQEAAVFTDDLVGNSAEYRFPPRALALRDKKLLFLVGLDDEVCFAEDHFFPLYRALESVSHPATDVIVLRMDHGGSPVGRAAIASRVAAWVAASGREELVTHRLSNERLQAFAASYAAAWNSGDPGRVARHYGEDGSLAINGGEPAVGREALAEVAESFMTGFPDMELDFDGLTFEDGRIQFHWTFRGTNTGPEGTGHRVDFSGFESWRLDEAGLIADSLGNFDAQKYRRQLEVGVGEVSDQIDAAVWEVISATVAANDGEGMAAVYHPDAVLVSPRGTVAIAEQLVKWGEGMERIAREGRGATVSFRFSSRQNNAGTAFERGMFRYAETDEHGVEQPAFIPFEALLVKKNGRWLMMMERQLEAADEGAWNVLATVAPLGAAERFFPRTIQIGQPPSALRPYLEEDCDRFEESHYTGEMAAPFTDQIQIDCYGLEVLGAERKAELMFNDGPLGHVWILIEPQEIEAIERTLSAEFGPVAFSSDNDRVFASGTVAVRTDPPEILVATHELIRALTGYAGESEPPE